MGTARRILSALIGAAAISLISSCGFGGGETDGVEVRLDPSRVAAAAREAVEGIEENEQVRVKVWAEFLCEYGAEKETREFTLFDKVLSHETELNEWTEGHLKDCSSFTIDGLPVGKTVTFTMSIHFKLSGAIDDEFTPYTSDPAKATIGVDRELTLVLHPAADDEDEKGGGDEKKIECTITATIPDGTTLIEYSSIAYIWIEENERWYLGGTLPGHIAGSTLTFTGSFYANVGGKAKVTIFGQTQGSESSQINYGFLTDEEVTVSDSGIVFSLGEISTNNQPDNVPAPAPFMQLLLTTDPNSPSNGNCSIEVKVLRDTTEIYKETWSGYPMAALSGFAPIINLTGANLSSPNGETVNINVNIKDSSGTLVMEGGGSANLGSNYVVPVGVPVSAI